MYKKIGGQDVGGGRLDRSESLEIESWKLESRNRRRRRGCWADSQAATDGIYSVNMGGKLPVNNTSLFRTWRN